MRVLVGFFLVLAVGRSLAADVSISFSEADRRALEPEERKAVTEIATAAIKEVSEILPGLPDAIRLEVVSGSEVIPGFGSVGLAATADQIRWTVDPTIGDGPIETARSELRHTMFHEAHHLVRGWTMSGATAGNRMIDAAVSEGMATVFERDAAGWNPPWGDYPPDDISGWVEELLAVDDGLRSYPKWMFYHPDGRQWIGYRAGTYIVDRAMKACKCSAVDLVSMPTDEVIALGAEQ